jgi:serine/threonine-protein kinase
MEDLADQHLLHYALVEKLGEGPSGQVYRAWDRRQHRTVALKILKQQVSNSERFQARCLATLNSLTHGTHPNVCTILSVPKVSDTHVVVMEYIEGVTLNEYTGNQPLELHKFLRIAGQIARGLRHVHDQLIVHGNIKPSNIMVTTDGVVKITDFGLSVYPDDDGASNDVIPLEALGLLAPERLRGEPASVQSDLFSLGALFYRVLTGKPAFTGDTYEEVQNSILHGQPDYQLLRTLQVPGDVILVVEKLLAKEPAERFSSAAELEITLREIRLFESADSSRKFLEVTPRTPRQYLMLSLLAVLLVVLWYVVTTYRH